MQLDSKEIVDSCLMIMDQMVIANKALEDDDDDLLIKSNVQRYEELKILTQNIDKNIVIFSTELYELKQEILRDIEVIETELIADNMQQDHIDDLIIEINNKSTLFIQHILLNALGDDSFYKLAKEKKLLKSTDEES